jgi:hypothetical protein
MRAIVSAIARCRSRSSWPRGLLDVMEPRVNSRSHDLARALTRGLFWVWVPLATLLGASLMATHWYTLPLPDPQDPQTLAALARLRGDGDAQRWLVVHVLYASCRCSGAVVQHLVDTPRPRELAERILLVGSEPGVDAMLAGSALAVVRVSPDELAHDYGIAAAPMLLVVDPDGRLRYRGGYTDRKQGADIRDLEIIERLRAQDTVPPLPMFGCAVSEQLRALLDPLGVRTLLTEEP